MQKTPALVLVALLLSACRPAPIDLERPPNVIYIYADDLGYGEVGPYGQTKIRTPNLDRLAGEGLRFTQHYSGSAVCAPSRAVLLTGRHTGHSYIRDNKELGGWGPDEPGGQWPLAAEQVTLAELLKDRGYVTGAIAKWGLGGPDGEGHPNNQGFDYYYGYLCQRVAHNYYPTHLWRNGDKHLLEGNEYFAAHQQINAPFDDLDEYGQFQGAQYAPDLMAKEVLAFIEANADEPFFLYYGPVVPHLALQVPHDSLAEYSGRFEETPYLGNHAYLPHPEPRAAYAAMITRMDREIGRILDLLDELGLADDTLILFSSDNGPSWVGGVDREFFDSTGGLRGRKAQLYEGGIRVPMIARWPGQIEPGGVTDHVSAQWDVLPTVLEITGGTIPSNIDGLSFAPTLLSRSKQARHAYLYWELGRQQAIRVDDWKLYRRADENGAITTLELYDLASDPSETSNLADQHPDVLAQLLTMARYRREPSELFPSPFDQE